MKHQEFALRSESRDLQTRTSIRAIAPNPLNSMTFIKVHAPAPPGVRFVSRMLGRWTNFLSSRHLAGGSFGPRHALHEVALPSESRCKPLCRMDLRPSHSNAGPPGSSGFGGFLQDQSRTSIRGFGPSTAKIALSRSPSHFRPMNGCNSLNIKVFAASHVRIAVSLSSRRRKGKPPRGHSEEKTSATHSALPSESPATG